LYIDSIITRLMSWKWELATGNKNWFKLRFWNRF